MSITTNTVAAQLAAIDMVGTGKRAFNALATDGAHVFEFAWQQLDENQQSDYDALAEGLIESEVRLVTSLDADYPERLRDLPAPPAFLLMQGNAALLHQDSVGVCGARNASERGMKAAAACCRRAVEEGFVVVSGNARGVDLTAHRSALESGGATIFVLPEGIGGFRIRRDLRDLASSDRVLVISQFAPRNPWSVGRAMERNGTIVGLSKMLIAVEPGATGGTIDAARKALTNHRPVAVIDPAGAAAGASELIAAGATAVSRTSDLEHALHAAATNRPAAQDRIF